MSEQFPNAWRVAITGWAATVPQITAVYLFGSRAKGCAGIDSDIDLAFETQSDGSGSAFTVAMCERASWQEQLQALLPVPVDFQYAGPEADGTVRPAMQDHGIRIV